MNEHVEVVADRAYKQLGFIKRVTRTFSNIECIKTLYFAYARSILEYGCNIWSPYYIIPTQRLESIQKQFLKYLAFKEFKNLAVIKKPVRITKLTHWNLEETKVT